MQPPSIFVSSSGADLIPFRVQCREVILKLGLQPIMMEYFPSSAESGTIASLDYVDRSSIFALILGWRYGVPPPGYTHSVTEMEYDRAFKQYQTRRMPMLVYLAEESTRAQPDRYFNVEGINTLGTDPQSRIFAEKLASWRNTLLSRHICKFFTTPQELALQFSTDLSVTVAGGYVSQGHILQAEEALKRGDFATSRAEAQSAVADLPGHSTGEDSVAAARARFLLALGLLGRQPVMTLSDNVFAQICDLVEAARRLQPNRLIYTRLLAALKHDYSANGFRHFEREAVSLIQQAQRLPKIPDDEADNQLIRGINPTLTLDFY